MAVLAGDCNCNVWKILSVWLDGLMYDTRQGTNLVPIQIASSRKHRLDDGEMSDGQMGRWADEDER